MLRFALGPCTPRCILGQANPDRRQMVVDVLCAYLRMPYAPPDRLYPPVLAGRPNGLYQSLRASKRDPAQELQVRLTAERLLYDHLRCPGGVSGEDAQTLRAIPGRVLLAEHQP